MENYKAMELSYINEPLPKIDRRLFLLVFLVTLGAMFALYEFPVYFAGLIVAIIFLAGVYNLPELGIAILVNGIYIVAFFWRGFEITYLVTPLTALLCTFGLVHYIFNNGLKWKFGLLPGVVLFIALILFVGILYSPLPSEGIIRAGKYLSLNLFVFFATMLFIDDLNKLRNLVKIIAYIGFGAVIISIIYIGYTGIGEISRFSLPGQNPIWFSRELGMSLLATLILMELTQKKFKKLAFAVFIFLMLFFIYITGSRGPIIGLFIALLFYFFILQKGESAFFKKLFFVLLFLLAFKFLVTAAPEQFWNRITNPFSGFDPTMFYRLRAFETAKDLFFNNPLAGVGTGGFGYYSILSYPHNIFLESASELGVGGFLALVILVAYTGYLGTRLIRAEKISTLKLNLSKFYFTIFIFSLVNAQFSGALCGNYELWFAAAGIWTLYATKQNSLER